LRKWSQDVILDNLYKQKLIHPPKWLLANTCYLTTMSSQAYGVSTDNSDLDVYGFCIPPKDIVFPHLGGVIPGFGNQGEEIQQTALLVAPILQSKP
jgi:uncharacterized protein